MGDFSCTVYTADGVAQLHDLLSNGLALAVLFTLGVGALLACYQVRVHNANGTRARLVFLALLAVSVFLGASLTFVGNRAVSTTATCESPGRNRESSHSARVERFGMPAYAVVVPLEGDMSPEPRVDKVAIIVNTLFWASLVCVILSLVCVILSLLSGGRRRLSDGFARSRHRSR